MLTLICYADSCTRCRSRSASRSCCFSLVHLAPGDPLNAVRRPGRARRNRRQAEGAYGFDQPLPVQYAKWLYRAAAGDLGRSIATGRPVSGEKWRMRSATPSRWRCVGGGDRLHVRLPVGRHRGLRAGRLSRQDRIADRAAWRVSVPHYWLGMVLVIVFSVELGALPAIGIGPRRRGDLGLGLASHLAHMRSCRRSHCR